MSGTVEAVLFDLDDTLYLQADWLAGAWSAVADAAAGLGVDRRALHTALVAIAAEGSDKGRIIDRALALVGAAHTDAAPLVAVFRSHRPARLEPLPGVREGLARLRRSVPVGLVTDGDPAVQRGKLDALGFRNSFDTVVVSDELGRPFRKPHPRPFEAALAALGVGAHRAVFVGDRPGKDVAGAAAVGMRTVRVRTGEYADEPSPGATWTVQDVVAAFDLLTGCVLHPAAAQASSTLRR